MQDPWQIATWRFELIAPFLDASVPERERRALLRERRTRPIEWPLSDEDRRAGRKLVTKPVSRATLYRWLSAYEEKKIEGLLPTCRKGSRSGRPERAPWVSYSIGLLYERPDRSLTQLLTYLGLEFPDTRIARSVLDRELKAHPAYRGIEVLRKTRPKRLRSRFESSRPHQVWQLDGKGPFDVRLRNGRTNRVHVLTILDDHSRMVLAATVALAEDTAAAVRVFRRAVRLWGLSDRMQFDLGSAFESWTFRKGLALLGSRRNWVKARNPEANGKIESYHRALVRWFVKELPHQEILDLSHLEDLLQAAIELLYNDHYHRELKTSPRQSLGGVRSERIVAEPELNRAFWAETRATSHPKTGIVELPNSSFRVPARYAGQKRRFLHDPELPQAVLVAAENHEIPLESAEKKRPFDEPAAEPKRGTGQLQKLLDRWRGQERPVAPAGFGLPEVFRAIGELVGRLVPANEQEATAIRAFYQKYGPLPAEGFRQATLEISRALGKGRPIQTYVDRLERLVRADRDAHQSKKTPNGDQP